MSESDTAVSKRFDVQPTASNHFAWMRTIMALQRTQLAAVRSAVSLIGFGFTVAQFFQKLVSSSGQAAVGPEMPRNVGLILIAAGIVSLAVFTWHFRSMIGYMSKGQFAALAIVPHGHVARPTLLVSYVVMLIGLLALASVFLRF